MLRAERISVSLSGIEILRDVTIDIDRGRLVGLVGRNGAGKTTTLKTMMGYYKPGAGDIYLDGHRITDTPPHIRARMGIGFVPEDMKIFPWFTARENIDLAIEVARKTNRRGDIYEEIYQVFPEIKNLLDRRGYYLSGGEKKMLAIARAMALEPRYILIDEAFEGLAPIVVERFRSAIKMIMELNIGVLIAESNFILASKICEELYVIERGEIIYRGDPSEALKNERVLEVIRGF
jgi:branched-chain amino acid transport system ATP-binding protein